MKAPLSHRRPDCVPRVQKKTVDTTVDIPFQQQQQQQQSLLHYHTNCTKISIIKIRVLSLQIREGVISGGGGGGVEALTNFERNSKFVDLSLNSPGKYLVRHVIGRVT